MMKLRIRRRTALSPGILRRQICAELIDLAEIAARFLATGGRSWAWDQSCPRFTGYNQAVYRLRRNGLIARRAPNVGPPTIELTSNGRRLVADEIVPERFWKRRWDGRWYILMYDVPERERSYRGVLNRFLTQMRMGCLQKSVFVSVRDIRPLFYDLDLAAAVAEYANLFESQTVHGQSDAAVAARAWDFDRLREIQEKYIKDCRARALQPGKAVRLPTVLDVMRAELAEYRAAMRNDPLLPKPLWPSGYLGPQVAAVFRRRMGRLAGGLIGRPKSKDG